MDDEERTSWALGLLVLLACIVGGINLIDMFSEPEPSTRTSASGERTFAGGRTMAEVLASEQEGKVPASQEMTSRISGLLDRLDAHCDESRLQISNRALKLKQMLTEDGEYATVLDVLVGLETAVEGTEVTDCTQVLAMLGTTW